MPLKLKEIDLFGDAFTYRMRIGIGEALRDAGTDFEAMRGVLAALHGVDIKPRQVARVFDYYLRVLEQLERWVALERQLRYEPTADERRAGIDQIHKELGHFATIDALALRMHRTHDQVLDMDYSTVFMVLKADMLHARYNEKLRKINDGKRN